MKKQLLSQLKEALSAAWPIGLIILVLHFTIAPLPLGTLVLMLVGMLLLVVGLTLFSLGTEMSMMPIGEHVGSALMRTKRMPVLIGILFIFGCVITAAEPDLQVLVNQVQSIPNMVLILSISAGVGVFLVFTALRLLFKWRLSVMLAIFYSATFLIAVFSLEYLAVSFDASAVTTGPITVPFLLAIGAGFAAISSTNRDEDNFGLCAICSVGPIFAVLVLGFFFDSSGDVYVADTLETMAGAGDLVRIFGQGLWQTFFEVLMVVIPIIVIFLIFQFIRIKLSKTELIKIFVGLAYLVVGLTIFLTGVNQGFMPAAQYLGAAIGALSYNWVLIPLSLLIGAGVVLAEPAVYVLTRQVEDITDGAISRRMMLFGMAAGVGLAMSLSIVRILYRISIWWFLLPGFAVAIALSFLVPPIFVGIGFDSGGVAAGTMSAAFVLPFAIGVCTAVGGNVVTDAFGIVGIIAMMPPITIQLMGLLYNIKLKRAARAEMLETERDAEEAEMEAGAL
ncbi:MAG: DUF1538 domain-containing protein [Oscillospiraceae bacterium]